MQTNNFPTPKQSFNRPEFYYLEFKTNKTAPEYHQYMRVEDGGFWFDKKNDAGKYEKVKVKNPDFVFLNAFFQIRGTQFDKSQKPVNRLYSNFVKSIKDDIFKVYINGNEAYSDKYEQIKNTLKVNYGGTYISVVLFCLEATTRQLFALKMNAAISNVCEIAFFTRSNCAFNILDIIEKYDENVFFMFSFNGLAKFAKDLQIKKGIFVPHDGRGDCYVLPKNIDVEPVPMDDDFYLYCKDLREQITTWVAGRQEYIHSKKNIVLPVAAPNPITPQPQPQPQQPKQASGGFPKTIKEIEREDDGYDDLPF